MNVLVRTCVFLVAIVATIVPAAHSAQDQPDKPLMLLATPQLADPVFGQTVLLAVPLREGTRIGVILNRPTLHPMDTLFPDHRVLNRIKAPVYFGGPMLPEVLVAIVRSDADPGPGALPVGDGLFLALSGPLIEKVLAEAPQATRCYIGSVIWQAGELDAQIRGGVWSVAQLDIETILSTHPESLWESLQNRARQQTAGPAERLLATALAN